MKYQTIPLDYVNHMMYELEKPSGMSAAGGHVSG